LAKICPLFSGSSGNSYYISSCGESILVDAGRSAKQLELAIRNNNLDIESIKAIFITHEHQDHIKGLRVFASRYNIDVYASCGTIESFKKMEILSNKYRCIKIDSEPIEVGGMEVRGFNTSHDCAEGLGFIVNTSEGTKLTIATDLGYISTEVRNAITGADVLVIESNHDERVLQNGSYPYYLKRRILSNLGHLSNNNCSKELPSFVNSGTKHIILGHLSRENNSESLAFETAICSFNEYSMKQNVDFTLHIAKSENHKGQIVVF
jgi:phosphoribosyl 1,2-cyclic phosphodiesterase